MGIFTIIYFIAIFIEMAIRAPISRQQRKTPKSSRRVTPQEKVLLGLLFLAMFFIPIFYAATSWFDFADYTLPAWVNWSNLFVFIVFYILRVRAEEQLMMEQFGDQYRSHVQKVGAVFPKF